MVKLISIENYNILIYTKNKNNNKIINHILFLKINIYITLKLNYIL